MRRGLLALTLVLAVLVSGGVSAPAVADHDGLHYGTPDTAEWDNYEMFWGWGCSLTAYTYGGGWHDNPRVHGDFACDINNMQAEAVIPQVSFRGPAPADVGGSQRRCLYVASVPDPMVPPHGWDLKDPADRTFSVDAEQWGTLVSPPTGGDSTCYFEDGSLGPINEVCIHLQDGEVAEYCQPIALEWPDFDQEPGEDDSAACPRGTLDAPVIAGPSIVGSAGAWQYQYEVFYEVAGKTGTPFQINGVTAYLMGYVSFSGMLGTWEFRDGTNPAHSDPPGWQYNANSTAGGSRTGAISLDQGRYNAAWTTTPTRTTAKLRVRTPVQAGEPGSVAAPTLRGAGYYVSRSLTGPTTTVHGFNGSLTEYQSAADWASLGTSPMREVGYQRPEWCYANWGAEWTSNPWDPARPLGPVQVIPPGSEKPPYVPPGAPNTEPPVYEPPTAPPPTYPHDDDDDPNTPPPDPDDEGCEGFSIFDPTSWASAGICALVKVLLLALNVLKDIFGALGDLAAAIAGLVGALLDGLLDLLLSLFVPDEFPDFTSIENPIPPGWLPTFPNLDGGACGPITIPTLSFPEPVGAITPSAFVDTCDQPWPTVRTLTYYGLLAGILVAVGNRAIRVVMSGFGMNVDNGSGGGDDDS